jgi:formylglycine-generating enzyme
MFRYSRFVRHSCAVVAGFLFCIIDAVALADVFNMPAGETSLQLVVVGNAGNANDPNTGNLYGGVGYNYSIGKYDVTVGQYAAFLNSVAATDPYNLYLPLMTSDLNIAGISRSGVSGNFTYTILGSANKPVAFLNWGDAARFVNWLYNGQPVGGEGPGTTETGSYTLNGATTNADLISVTRNPNATWVLPTENEWFKAAYYNPSTSTYFKYPFSSNTNPTPAPPGNTPNTGNFLGPSGYATTGTELFYYDQNYLTDVGAYTASASPYGAFDMGGDVFQWNETLIYNGSIWGRRGGSFRDQSSELAASLDQFGPSAGYDVSGFRVAFVPEPSTLALFALGSLGLLVRLRLVTNTSPTIAT